MYISKQKHIRVPSGNKSQEQKDFMVIHTQFHMHTITRSPGVVKVLTLCSQKRVNDGTQMARRFSNDLPGERFVRGPYKSVYFHTTYQ